jgi:hypothetical protein
MLQVVKSYLFLNPLKTSITCGVRISHSVIEVMCVFRVKVQTLRDEFSTKLIQIGVKDYSSVK